MRQASLPIRPAWREPHQRALQLFRALDTLQRVRPSLQPGTLAWRRLDCEQAALEVAIEVLWTSVQRDR